MKSLRFQVFSFLAAVMVLLLLLLNVFPIVSSRDTVFQELHIGKGIHPLRFPGQAGQAGQGQRGGGAAAAGHHRL